LTTPQRSIPEVREDFTALLKTGEAPEGSLAPLSQNPKGVNPALLTNFLLRTANSSHLPCFSQSVLLLPTLAPSVPPTFGGAAPTGGARGPYQAFVVPDSNPSANSASNFTTASMT
jgi:hypothetical protein